MPRHADFEKIYQAFLKRYGQVEGEKNYYAWLSKMGLDDTKSYQRPQESLGKEKFNWAQVLFNYLREDETKKHFKVEASFPLSSMNNNVYTEDELLRGARSLVGKPCNLNHEGPKLDSVSIEGAEYEDGAVECVLGFLKGSDVLGMVEKGEIVHVSTEADCLQGLDLTADGAVCKGLVYTGLALLTKDELPGVPLTRIMPVESIVESFQVMTKNGGERVSENDKVKNEAWGDVSFPDSSFAWVPDDAKGPDGIKSNRKLPYKDADGKVDLDHVRNALARLDQTDGIPAAEKEKIRAMLQDILAKANPDYKPPEAKEGMKTPCEEVKEALLVRVSTLEGKFKFIEDTKAAEQKVFEEKAVAEKKAAEAKRSKGLSVLTKEGFWARFHELRRDGCSKTDAFRLVSMEVIEASTRQQEPRLLVC
jgi:hypothetical protein